MKPPVAPRRPSRRTLHGVTVTDDYAWLKDEKWQEVLRDPSLLDRYDHALWRFMDQLAHDLTLCAPGQRMRLLGLGRNLIDHLASTDARDSHSFAWALERLLAAQRHVLNQAVAAANTGSRPKTMALRMASTRCWPQACSVTTSTLAITPR